MPGDCPVSGRNNLPSATGGSPILEYLISYNEKEDFTGLDAGEMTTNSTTCTVSRLTKGRTYYFRILARNQQGSGFFCSYSDAYSIPFQGLLNVIGSRSPVAAVAYKDDLF